LTAPDYIVDPAAERDLDAYTDYLIAEAGSGPATDFVECARRSFLAIAATPGIGPTISSRNLRLSGLRKWRIEKFPKLLIFYVPQANAVEIIRVLHAAQDWWSLLDAD
jgi:toxin ParE1/3/4